MSSPCLPSLTPPPDPGPDPYECINAVYRQNGADGQTSGHNGYIQPFMFPNFSNYIEIAAVAVAVAACTGDYRISIINDLFDTVIAETDWVTGVDTAPVLSFIPLLVPVGPFVMVFNEVYWLQITARYDLDGVPPTGDGPSTPHTGVTPNTLQVQYGNTWDAGIQSGGGTPENWEDTGGPLSPDGYFGSVTDGDWAPQLVSFPDAAELNGSRHMRFALCANEITIV